MPRLRDFQPIQIVAAHTMETGDDFVIGVNEVYRRRRDVLVEDLGTSGWKIEKPQGTMFVWAELPGPYVEMGSLDFSIKLLEEAGVAVSPGIGFGVSGEGNVRFALVEDEDRIAGAVERMGSALDRL